MSLRKGQYRGVSVAEHLVKAVDYTWSGDTGTI